MKFFIYFTVLVSILFLPERIWNFLWVKIEKVRLFLSHANEKNPLLKERVQGEKLLNFLPELEAKMGMGIKTAQIEIPHYKFYTKLLYDLLDVHRRLGISLKFILPELRSNLLKDLSFEKKISSSILGGNLQFLVISFTTWAFIFFSSALAEIPLNVFDLFLILIVQILAVIVFNIVTKKVRGFIFLKYSHVIEELYLFSSMVEIGLPAGKVLSESKILDGDLVKFKEFYFCAARTKEHVARWRENGISPKIGVGEVVAEIWQLKEGSFLKFLKTLDLIKFSVLAFFFLPAYFYYLYSIFQFFLLQ